MIGSGKTTIFANLIKHIPVPKECPTATKVLVIAHRTELLSQAAAQIKRVSPDCKILLEQGRKKPSVQDLESCDVVVASVATLGNAISTRRQNYDPKQFKCVIIDEAHHASATTYTRLLTHLGALSDASHLLVWGCSATLRRHDGRSLAPVFQEIVYHKPFLEMIRQEYLCNLRVTVVQTETSLDGIKSVAGDFVMSQLASRVNTPLRNRALLEAWEEKAKDTRKSTLIFAANVQHIQDLVTLFTAHGHTAHGIHAQTPPHIRSHLLHQFRTHQFPVLINCGILTEGVDIASIDCVVLARPTRSGVLLQQMIGRGVRVWEGKKDCLIVDLVDVSAGCEGGLESTVPSLLGLRRDFVLEEDQDIAQMMEKISSYMTLSPHILEQSRTVEEAETLAAQHLEKKSPTPTPACELTLHYQEYNFLDLFDGTGGEEDEANRPLHAVSPFAWVRVGKWEFVLGVPGKGDVVVKKEEDTGHFSATHRQKRTNPKTRTHWTHSTHLLTHDTLTSVLQAADSWITSHFSYLAHSVLRRGSAWRRKPASDAQVSFLRKRGVVGVGVGMSMGKATDLITRMVCGGVGKARREGVEVRKRERRERREGCVKEGKVL
ncbi:hypothetical protein HDU98_006095 [Podochytrium sp. JEL0797]|nr:hypothetical protein HDU98_006095 [Podochytrium sp. JEL0797]